LTDVSEELTASIIRVMNGGGSKLCVFLNYTSKWKVFRKVLALPNLANMALTF
jgi:hypothetical protein